MTPPFAACKAADAGMLAVAVLVLEAGPDFVADVVSGLAKEAKDLYLESGTFLITWGPERGTVALLSLLGVNSVPAACCTGVAAEGVTLPALLGAFFTAGKEEGRILLVPVPLFSPL